MSRPRMRTARGTIQALGSVVVAAIELRMYGKLILPGVATHQVALPS